MNKHFAYRLPSWWWACLLFGLLAGCQTVSPPVSNPPPAKPASARPAEGGGSPTTVAPASASAKRYSTLKPELWQALPELNREQWLDSWPVWLQSCQALQKKVEWRAVCASALTVNAGNEVEILAYWQANFDVYRLSQLTGEFTGLITGYYQPVLRGAKTATERYHVPLYQVPPDLIQVNLAGLYPELKFKRLRGRVQGQALVPYFSRAEIEQASSPLAGNELLWVEDAVEAFFLQVQGSGVVMLDNGERVHIGYADQNGHPYQSIGKLLVERGELTASAASMQGIKHWGQQHPEQLRSLLDSNPSYVFFKVLPPGLSGPLGALGVPLTARRSIAIDPSFVPLGAPVYIATTYPNSGQNFNQLMLAQDTGGAIKGGVRADIYWGEGDAAGQLAGAMRQPGQMWVWLPKGYALPSAP